MGKVIMRTRASIIISYGLNPFKVHYNGIATNKQINFELEEGSLFGISEIN